ncbi:MAG TPA: DNA-binding transcriptional regulator Fis [Gammaproteobacteria bacterium]|nr:DNA-binding transcriptional regulator Fis [Gammaproteobacteria bacterium]
MSVPAEKQNIVNAATLRRETSPQLSQASQTSQISQASQTSHQTLRDAVRTCLEKYFADLDGHEPAEIHQLVMNEVEPAMLETVMRFARGNQTRAADMLGINRTTLRKKLRQYGLEL